MRYFDEMLECIALPIAMVAFLFAAQMSVDFAKHNPVSISTPSR